MNGWIEKLCTGWIIGVSHPVFLFQLISSIWSVKIVPNSLIFYGFFAGFLVLIILRSLTKNEFLYIDEKNDKFDIDLNYFNILFINI